MRPAVYLSDVDMCEWTAPDISITVGRKTIEEGGGPAYAVVLWHNDQSPFPPTINMIDIVGQPLRITAGGLDRFIGEVSDATIEHDIDGAALFRIVAAGPLSLWGKRLVAPADYPVEPVATRAQRIAVAIDQPLNVQGGADVSVTARSVADNTSNAGVMLRELAVDTGGWVFDHAGFVYLQSLDARAGGGAVFETWADQTTTWDVETDTWLDQTTPSPGAPQPLQVDPCAVQWSPKWETRRSDINNVINVKYADTEEITVTDSGSITRFGRYDVNVDTRLATLDDAITRGNQALLRAAHPRYRMDSVVIDVDTSPNAQDLLAATPGARVYVDQIPQPAPYTGFLGFLEGWDEVFFTNGAHRLNWFLSDLPSSLGGALTWESVDPAETWLTAQGSWLEATEEV